LDSLDACELRYIAGYLGARSEPNADREELQLAIFSSSSVVGQCSCEELEALTMARLRQLLRCKGMGHTDFITEKGDLVMALFASGCFHEEPALRSSDSGPVRNRPTSQTHRAVPY